MHGNGAAAHLILHGHGLRFRTRRAKHPGERLGTRKKRFRLRRKHGERWHLFKRRAGSIKAQRGFKRRKRQLVHAHCARERVAL